VGTKGTTPGKVVGTKHNNGNYQTVQTTLIHPPLVDTIVGTNVLGTIAGRVVETKHNIGDSLIVPTLFMHTHH